jgi:hypothetical protein
VVELAKSLKGYKGSNEWIKSLREKDDIKEEANTYYDL